VFALFLFNEADRTNNLKKMDIYVKIRLGIYMMKKYKVGEGL